MGKRRKGIDYLPPGGTEWHHHETDEEKREGRLAARRLLQQSDDHVRKIFDGQRKKRSDELELERGMAAAVGAWDRWISASVQKLVHEAEEVGKGEVSEILRKLLGG